MVQPQYSPEEALNRVKLMMGYDSSKTLNENKSVIFEQIASPDEYFKSIVKGYMKYPEKMTVNYGSPKIDPKKNAQAFQKAISPEDSFVRMTSWHTWSNMFFHMSFLRVVLVTHRMV